MVGYEGKDFISWKDGLMVKKALREEQVEGGGSHAKFGMLIKILKRSC